MTNEQKIERVARAIFQTMRTPRPWEDLRSGAKDNYRRMARAAIKEIEGER